jgi:hypothetical protein
MRIFMRWALPFNKLHLKRMEKNNWLIETIKLLSVFFTGVLTDKFIKWGKTKIINQNVCFYYPFAFQGKEMEINKAELHLQLINNSGNASVVSNFFLQMKLDEMNLGFPFYNELSPAAMIKQKSSETLIIPLQLCFRLTQSEFIFNSPSFKLEYKLNDKKHFIEFENFSLIEEPKSDFPL